MRIRGVVFPAAAAVVVLFLALTMIEAELWARIIIGVLAALIVGFVAWLVAGVLKFGDERRQE